MCSTHVFRLSLACLAVLPSQAHAQEALDPQEATGLQEVPNRFVLGAGIAGENRGCHGHYVGIDARVAGPVSLYGMVENYRCAQWSHVIDLSGGITGTIIHPRRTGSDYRIGASFLLGRSSWLVRPALRAGIQYDGGDHVEPTAGASLTFGRRYGARLIVHLDECGSTVCERYQMGGYISF
ncbi:MAG: hypothetical protein OXU74_04100 [Gemmatimonadota bacterium]|nr:hypothetical protein [Gemmatimonadota bacterium]